MSNFPPTSQLGIMILTPVRLVAELLCYRIHSLDYPCGTVIQHSASTCSRGFDPALQEWTMDF